MSDRDVVAAERSGLCDSLAAAGPDAPTLCDGWTTGDLAAHLLVRERDPFGAPGILLPGPFAELTERRMRVAQRMGYDRMLATLQRGEPLWWRVVPAWISVVEMFVHHEDVRRAVGAGPRPADEGRDGLLTRWLTRIGPLYSRPAGCGVVAEVAGGDRHVLRRGEPAVVLGGPVGEIVLYLHGRKRHAEVELDGPSDAVAQVEAARFGV